MILAVTKQGHYAAEINQFIIQNENTENKVVLFSGVQPVVYVGR
jgi:hypothetical protein